MKKPTLLSLKTRYERDLEGKNIPLPEYPRPQLVRDSYICLNGEWNFKIINIKSGNTEFDGKITVPFVPESRLSGVEREIKCNEKMVYSLDFGLPEGFLKDRLILHFGAVDQYCTVYVNNSEVGKNTGGYLPFNFDITDYIKNGFNTLTVVVTDPLDTDLSYGKQSKKRGGMWYTPVSGIWAAVWLESVSETYIKALKITPYLDSVNIKIDTDAVEKTIILETHKGDIEYSVHGDNIDINIENPHLWSPEDPYLYHFRVKCEGDEVRSYFALRKISVEVVGGVPLICLNGEPYYFHGLLDQGYYSDGIYTPASYKAYEDDILQMKACGFNMLRKHIKTEPEMFYYYCDKHGMIVFQDFVNSGKYSFFIDTALPTVFLKRGVSHRANKKRREEFVKMGEGIVNTYYNHPSVCYYTIFNEGWGQFSADRCYKHFKALDETRIYDTASGWFRPKFSDVQSEHIYFKPVKLKVRENRPLVLSEFGGYSCKIGAHAFNLDKTYGYRYFHEVKAFEDALVRLYQTEIMPALKLGLNVTVLTQVSDVEDETNGLMTYDREILKVDAKRMNEMAQGLKAAFFDAFGKKVPKG